VPLEPSPPDIGTVTYDVARSRVYTQVKPGSPADIPSAPDSGGAITNMNEVDWVRVYHPDFTGGYLELKRVSTWWEDAYGYEGTLPAPGWRLGMRLVAYSKGFKVTIVPLDSANDQKAYQNGGAFLNAAYDYTATDWWYVPQADLDRAGPPTYADSIEADWFHAELTYLVDNWKAWIAGTKGGAAWTPADGLPDVYLRSSQYNYRLYFLAFHVAAAKAPSTGEAYYQTITRRTVKDYEPLFLTQPPKPGYTEPFYDAQVGDVFLFKTTEGRYGKLIIRARTADYSWWGDSSWQNDWFDYVVYVTDP
jgi:hypothetical protein